VSESADSMRKSIASLKTLHQQRWESSGRSGCFSDERFESFLVATSERFAERQQCKVFSLHAEDVPIASQLVLCNPDEYYVYQTGRDPNWESQSIGRLLNLLVIRQACQQSVRFLDYLRGNEIYKHRLGAAPSDCVRYRLIPPRWLPQVLHRATQFGRTIKHSFQQQRPSPQAVSSEEAI
ncbi:MAG: GNAT family N-acetyltransferase, partial [Planctomycetales bacterium]|nr:GNAT family N-acetyltransferase [Planctomycetales bacterium]